MSSAVVALLVLLLAWLVVRVLQARHDLNATKAHLLSARTALTDRDAAKAAQQANAAAAASSSARSAVDDPVVRLAGAIPVLGRSVEAVRGVAKAADEIVGSVIQPLVGVVDDLKPADLRRSDGSINLPLLASVQPALEKAAARSAAITREANALPRSLVVWPVSHAASSFRGQLSQLTDAVQKAEGAVKIAPTMLGADRPRRWFVMLQQSSESRGTGGIVGGFAVLTTDHGRLAVEAQGTNKDLLNRTEAVPPSADLPKDFVQTWEYSGVFDLWQNVNESPDLPSVAKVVRDRWKAETGKTVDGLIAVDPISLMDLLKGHPPLTFSGRTVPINDLAYYLLRGQYDGATDKGVRKDQLAAVAHEVLDGLISGKDSSSDLLSGMSAAARSGHLHVAAVDPDLNGKLQQLGIDGSLPKGPAPVAYAVLNNASGNKLDYYLDRKISYTAGGCDGKRRDSTITVTLSSRVPAAKTLPAYVILRAHPKGLPTYSPVNQVYLSIYATRGAVLRSARLDKFVVSALPGVTTQQLDVGSEQGLPSWSLPFDIKPGETRRLTLRLSEPVVKGSARVPEQPLPTSLARHVQVPAC